MDAHSLAEPTVILVDDDAALLRALSFSLELEGLRIDAHRRASSVRPDELPKAHACLVIDYYLPGANGLELLRRLREAGVTLPAILITTLASDMLRREAAALGATVVEKPLLGPELLTRIRHLLSIPDCPRSAT